MARKKTTGAVKEERKAPNQDNLVTDFDSWKEVAGLYKINPLEKMMGIELLTNGYEFYVQYQIESDAYSLGNCSTFFADFKLKDSPILIEVEGKIHEDTNIAQRDKKRHNILVSEGYTILYFDWKEVVGNESIKPIEMIDQASVMVPCYTDLDLYDEYSRGEKAGKGENENQNNTN